MARKDLSEIVVMDLEATCWKSKEEQGTQTQEIIEIGLSLLPVDTLIPVKIPPIIVKPKYSTVSKFCTDLTSLTQEDVDKGMDLYDAFSKIWEEYRTGERWVCCWGAWDFEQIKRECYQRDLRNPISDLRTDVKSYYTIIKGLSRGVSMMTALEQLDIKHEGIHHRGNDDAYNIAKIFSKLLKGSRDSL